MLIRDSSQKEAGSLIIRNESILYTVITYLLLNFILNKYFLCRNIKSSQCVAFTDCALSRCLPLVAFVHLFKRISPFLPLCLLKEP